MLRKTVSLPVFLLDGYNFCVRTESAQGRHPIPGIKHLGSHFEASCDQHPVHNRDGGLMHSSVRLIHPPNSWSGSSPDHPAEQSFYRE